MEPIALVQVLSASIAPCVLISAFGLLLLSLTNRLGRSVDRIRQLCREAPGAEPAEEAELDRQVRLLYRRCKLMRAAVGRNALALPVSAKDILRAAVLRNMIVQIFKNAEGDD